MKVTRLATYVLEAKAEKAIEFGAGSYGTFTATVVELTTDDGLVGVGECIARRAPRITDVVVRDLLWPVVEGRDPRDHEAIWDDMFRQLRAWGHYRGFVQEAMSGIDQALWDISAQAQGLPLWKALGGAARPSVPVYASKVYTATFPAMAKEAALWVELGHTAIKVQFGRSPQRGGHRGDIEVARTIRETVGPDVEIGADANCAYDAATAIRVGHEVAKYDLAFLEEPVYADDLDGYELIRRSQPVPIAGGESEFGIFGFRELFRRRALDLAQPDISRIGGFTAAQRLGALIHAHNVRSAPHTGFSCGVSQVASLHLASAIPNLWKVEWMLITANPLAEIFEEPLPQAKAGVVALPTKPGLGMTLDRKKLEKYALR